MQDARAPIDLSAAGRTHRPGRHALLRMRRIPCRLFFCALLDRMINLPSAQMTSSLAERPRGNDMAKPKLPNFDGRGDRSAALLCHARDSAGMTSHEPRPSV